MTYLLDTNAMTAWAKKDAHFIARIKTSVPADLRISVMTEHELRYGIACNPNLRLRPVLERMLTMLQKVMVDSDIAANAALVRADLRRQGQPIGPYDLLIAATALTHHLTVVTHNTREFSRVAGLRLEDWQQ